MVATQVHRPRLGLIPLTPGQLAVNVLNTVSLLDLLCLRGLKVRALHGVTGQYHGVKAHLRTPIWDPCQVQSSSWLSLGFCCHFITVQFLLLSSPSSLTSPPTGVDPESPTSPKCACLKTFISKSASQRILPET